MIVAALTYLVVVCLGVFDGMGAWALILAAPFALAVLAIVTCYQDPYYPDDDDRRWLP